VMAREGHVDGLVAFLPRSSASISIFLSHTHSLQHVFSCLYTLREHLAHLVENSLSLGLQN
jgi:hypothetical protein